MGNPKTGMRIGGARNLDYGSWFLFATAGMIRIVGVFSLGLQCGRGHLQDKKNSEHPDFEFAEDRCVQIRSSETLETSKTQIIPQHPK